MKFTLKNIFFTFLFLSSPLAFSQNNYSLAIDLVLSKSAQILKKSTDSSLQYAFQAAEMSQEAGDTIRLAKSYHQIAEAYDEADEVDRIIVYRQKALEAIKNFPDDTLKGRIVLNMGKAHQRKGNYAQAIPYYRQAKTIALKLNHSSLAYAVYNELGYSHLVHNYINLDSAQHYFNGALQLAEEMKDTLKTAVVYSNISTIYGQKKEWDTELKYINMALTLFEKKNDLEGISRSYKRMGDMYYFTKQNLKSIMYYEKAYELTKRLNNTSGTAVAACDLAYMYAMEKEKAKFEKLSDESVRLAAQTKSWSTIRYAAGWLSEANEILGDYKKAYELHKMYSDANDSINNRAVIERVSRADIQETFDEKFKTLQLEEEKRKVIAEEKEKYQSFIRNILIVGILIALILLFFTYRNFIQKKKANIIISRQKEEVEEQKFKIEEFNKEITDSIKYALTIQRSILPTEQEILKSFPQSFRLYRPRNVVSGDFYWCGTQNGMNMMAAVDCTGHGVPGALMSMIGIDKLNEAVAGNLTNPSAILSFLNTGIKTTLQQRDNSSGSQDGMDIAICCFDFKKKILHFAGAQRPLWLIRNDELFEYKATKVSVGGTTSNTQKFATHDIPIQKNDSVYFFTDGFADQFGGAEGKKMKTKNFRELLYPCKRFPF